MKNLLSFLIILIVLSVLTYNSNAGTNFGFFAGLSTPNDEVNNIYNSSKINLIELESNSGKLIREAAALGYHIGAKMRFSLTEDFSFTGSAAWHRFPESQIDVKDPIENTTVIILNSTQNIIPITVGMNYYFLNSFIGVYSTGELAYSYIHSTVDYEGIPLININELDKSPTDSRVGFGLGAGVDLDLKLLMLNLEAKYNVSNFIGKVSNEKTKAYFTLSIGVYF